MSPMLDLQRRHAEVFRIRFGEKSNGRPVKLTESIKVTAAGQSVVQAFADRYGGEVEPFTENSSRDRWQVKLPISELYVMVLPGQSISQWWEMWRGSACERRCDGETESLSGQPCMCPSDIAVRMRTSNACRPTTRVSVICPDVEVVGAGRFESHGLIAAETLPQSIAIAEAALARGLTVPAVLRAIEHKGRTHYIVPQLEIVGVSLHQLATGEVPTGIQTGVRSELAAPVQRAIGSGAGSGDPGGDPVRSGGVAGSSPATATAPRTSPPSGAPPVGPLSGAREQPALPHELAGAPPTDDKACSRCGLPLAGGGDVEKGQAGESKYVHKQCPTPPNGNGRDDATDTASTEAGEAEQATLDDAAEEVTDAEVVSQYEVNRRRFHRGLMATARDAFADDDKATREAKRHAVIRDVTNGRATSTKDCSNEELLKAWGRLRDIVDNRIVVVEDRKHGWRLELAARAS